MRWSCELINSIYTNNSGHGTWTWGTRGINESILRLALYFDSLLLAPTGALEEAILYVRASVRDIIQIIIENEF